MLPPEISRVVGSSFVRTLARLSGCGGWKRVVGPKRNVGCLYCHSGGYRGDDMLYVARVRAASTCHLEHSPLRSTFLRYAIISVVSGEVLVHIRILSLGEKDRSHGSRRESTCGEG